MPTKAGWPVSTHPFNGPFSGTTQKGKTSLDFTEARDSEWQWHELEHMQVCTSLQTDNHASTPPFSFYRPDALPAAQPTASKYWRHQVDLYNGCKLVVVVVVVLLEVYWCHQQSWFCATSYAVLLTRQRLGVQAKWRHIMLSKWNHIFKNQLRFPRLRWW